jgi:hypothetical protein
MPEISGVWPTKGLELDGVRSLAKQSLFGLPRQALDRSRASM